ncbi:MAG: YdcF family protein [Paucibacter sp.]|nr:YdcF family protein [Roseateles sp.]
MFLVLKAVLLVLLLPPVPWLLAIVAGVVLVRRRPRPARWLMIGGVVAIWVSCTEGAAQLLSVHVLHVPAGLHKAELAALRQQGVEHHDVAVLVLGGGANPNVPEYDGDAALKPWTMERLHYGLWLARRIDAPIGFTGGVGWAANGMKISEAELAQRVAANDYGLPLRWVESQSRDTRENAHYSLPMLASSNIHTVVIVTTGMHMPRALRDFRAELPPGMRLVAAPVSLRADATSEVLDWCPSFHGLERVQYALYEIFALLAGH